MKKVTSICPYCGCGCKLDYAVENQELLKTFSNKSDEVSEGKACIKGLSVHEVLDKGRILKPMIRKDKDSELEEVSWKQALNFVYEKTKGLSPREVLFVPSGKITNEDNYVIQKFAELVFKTKNVDNCCSRLCHAVTVEALTKSFGAPANPWKMHDVYTTDCLLIIGSNPASNHPVLFEKILKNKKMKVISVQPMMNLTSEHSDLSLIVSPWSEATLIATMINHLIKTKNYDKKCEKIEGFSKLKNNVKKYSVKDVCKECGIKEKEFFKLMKWVINSKSFAIIHGMGITQDENAMENIHNLLNLLILKNGKLLSCRGEVNVQGASDMCYGKQRGKNIVQALLISPVKAAFISAFNPAQSMPDLDRVHKNLKKIFLVQMDSYFNLTSEFADVILPTPTLIERTGTITNGERRVRFVKNVIKPLGEARPEWQIFKELSRLFGLEDCFDYRTEKDIFKEIVKSVSDYEDISVDFVYDGGDDWAKKEMKFCKFVSKKFKPMKDTRTKKYPFILITFRSQFHFLTGEMSTKSKTLNKSLKESYCYMNEDDAKRLKLRDGDKIKITSRVSSIETKVKIDKRFPRGIIGTHFHFKELLVNKLFPSRFEKKTYTPDYKSIEVMIEKM